MDKSHARRMVTQLMCDVVRLSDEEFYRWEPSNPTEEKFEQVRHMAKDFNFVPEMLFVIASRIEAENSDDDDSMEGD